MLNFAFSGTEVLLGGGLLVLLVLGIIVGARRAFRHPRIQISKEDLRTKYAAVDVFRYRTTLLSALR